MLMTKYIFLVHKGQTGHHTVVTRLTDGTQKYFFQAGGTVEGITSFMNSMTDELCDGYWPKKASTVDNWAFLEPNPDRKVAEDLARRDLTHHRLKHTI